MGGALNIKQVYWIYFLTLLILPLSFLIRLLYSNSLSLMEFGLFYSILNFIQLLLFFSNMGLSSSLKYHIPKFLAKKDYVSARNIFYYTIGIQSLVILIISFLLYIFSYFLSFFYFNNPLAEEILQIFLLYFISFSLYKTLVDIFLAHGLHTYGKFLKFFQLFVIFVLSFFIFFISTSTLQIYSWIWSITSIPIIIFSTLFFFIKFPFYFSFPTFNKKLLKEHFKYSGFLFLGGFGTLILNKLDIFIITFFLGVSSVGIYSNAFSLITVLASFFTSLAVIFLPIFSELQEKKQFKSLNNILNIFYNLILFFVIPFSLVFFLFPEALLRLLFGEEYVAGATILAIFSLFSIFKIISTYNLSFINGLGYAKQSFLILGIMALINLLLNYLLISKYELLGVTVATIICWVLITIFTQILISKEIHFKLNIGNTLKIFFSAIVFVTLVLTLKQFISIFNPYITIFFILAFSFTIYLILGYLLKIYTINDLYIFIPSKKLKQTLKRYHKTYLPNLK